MGLDAENLVFAAAELMRISLKLNTKTRRCILQDREDKKEYIFEFPEKSPYVYFYTILRPLGKEAENAAYLRALLELNMFGLQTDGGTISGDRANGNLVLHSNLPLDYMTPQLFVNTLTNFIVTAKKLRGKLENLQMQSWNTQQSPSSPKANFSAAASMEKNQPANKMRVIRI
ncbi:MAG: CesT family type III secretion system chaperone [Puniceicoccales bacterium]|jgi:hypothetical protein|nr:CesT family type III secretion system chaperone [Puniceicoccales bacterium]